MVSTNLRLTAQAENSPTKARGHKEKLICHGSSCPFSEDLAMPCTSSSQRKWKKKIRHRSYAEGAWNVTKGVRSIRWKITDDMREEMLRTQGVDIVCQQRKRAEWLGEEGAGPKQGWHLHEWRGWGRAFPARRRAGAAQDTPRRLGWLQLQNASLRFLATPERRVAGMPVLHLEASSVPGMWDLWQKQIPWQRLED